MSKLPPEILRLPIEERALLALKSAVKKMVAEHKRLGLPVYIWRDGQVVDLLAKKKPRKRSQPASLRIARKKKPRN